MRYFLAVVSLAICFGCGPSVQVTTGGGAVSGAPAEQHLYPAKIGDKYGYIDQTGAVVIPPQWWSAGDFSEGRAWVMPDYEAGGTHMLGYIDTTGKLVIPAREYEPLSGEKDVHEGLLPFAGDGGYGYMDRDGKVVIKPQFNFGEPGKDSCGCEFEGGPVSDFSEGFAFVHDGNRSYYIDKTGKRAFGRDFKEGGGFSEGLAAANDGKTAGYIDKNGKWVITSISGDAFSEGVAAVSSDDTIYFYIGKDGKQAIPGQFTYATSFSEGVAVVRDGHRSGFLDHSGQVKWMPEGWEFYALHDGLAKVYVDTSHTESIGSSSHSYSDHQIIYVDRYGNVAFRLTGSDIEHNRYGQTAENFQNGLLRVTSQDKDQIQGYVDQTGRWIWRNGKIQP